MEPAVKSTQRQPEVIRQIQLKADSACNAWYHLRLLRIQDGYVIEKSSGSERGQGPLEAWFRWGREDAERVFSKIVQRKTRTNRTRVYRMCPASAQLELFSAEH
jgi:hypothetical protein